MSRSTPRNLQELMNEMQSLQAQQQEETRRLRRRLDWLEARRREFFDIMANGDGGMENRRRLEDAERQLDQIHQMLHQSDNELKQALQDLRSRLMELRNEELTRLEGELRTLRDRKEHIHQRLLPEALARVNELKEEEDGLAGQLDELTERMRELNQIDPTNIQSQVA